MAAAKKSSAKKATEKKVVAKPKVVKKTTPSKPRPLTEKEAQEDKEIQELIANAAKAKEPAVSLENPRIEEEKNDQQRVTSEDKEVKREGEDPKVTKEETEKRDEETEEVKPSTDEAEEATDTVAIQEAESEKPKDQEPPLITDTVTVEKQRRLWPLFVLFFLIGLIAGGVFFMTQKSLDITQLLSFSAPTPTPSPSPTPSPTPEEAKPSEYKIKVLNGSGTAGEAAKVKELLEKSGFVVSDIGNADKDDYTKTEIQAKKYVTEAFIKKLREELVNTYDVSTDIGTPEGEDGIVVIIGSEKTP